MMSSIAMSNFSVRISRVSFFRASNSAQFASDSRNEYDDAQDVSCASIYLDCAYDLFVFHGTEHRPDASRANSDAFQRGGFCEWLGQSPRALALVRSPGAVLCDFSAHPISRTTHARSDAFRTKEIERFSRKPAAASTFSAQPDGGMDERGHESAFRGFAPAGHH